MIEALVDAVDGAQAVNRLRTGNTLIEHMIDPRGIVYVSENGFISGRIVQTVISTELVAIETGWFATDRSGLQLLRMFERWSQDHGAALVVMSCKGRKAQKILDRRGYREAEISMVKRWPSLQQ